MKLTLPIPPSNNHYKRYYCEQDSSHRVGAFVPAHVKQYKADAGWLAKQAGARVIEGDVAVVMNVYLGKLDIDADNLFKVVLDALNGIAWADDSQIVDLHIRKHRGQRRRRLEIEIGQAGS